MWVCDPDLKVLTLSDEGQVTAISRDPNFVEEAIPENMVVKLDENNKSQSEEIHDEDIEMESGEKDASGEQIDID